MSIAEPLERRVMLAANFKHTMPPRFGLDANHDGRIDLHNDLGFIQQSKFTVTLDASASTLPQPITSYQWLVSQGDTQLRSGTTKVFTLDGLNKLPEGVYTVKLTVSDGTNVDTLIKNINVQDILIVAMGDSIASGEGNPDKPKPAGGVLWADSPGGHAAHRSGYAASVLAAKKLETDDESSSVTFVFLAVSGATISESRNLLGTNITGGGLLDGQVKGDQTYPHTVNFDNFRTLFARTQTLQGEVTFWRYICNSIVLAGGGTFISMVFSSMGGYALAKYRFAGRAGIVTFMLASMTIPAIVLLAPSFEVIWLLGWMDSYRALLVPGAVSVFGIFLYRQAMLGVPDDLLEAGRIDGCGEFRIYLTLVMPLVRPMTGAYCLISFLASWNAFIVPNVFLQSQAKLTLPVVLNQYINVYQQQYGVFLAGTLLAIALPASLFLALQREFIAGLTSGAVKQ